MKTCDGFEVRLEFVRSKDTKDHIQLVCKYPNDPTWYPVPKCFTTAIETIDAWKQQDPRILER